MSKVKISPEPDLESQVPPMPGSGGEFSDPSGSQSTFSAPTSDAPEGVSPELAAELIGLPYEMWAQFEPEDIREAIVLSQKMKDFLGGPAARVLTKYGMGKIAKDEVVLLVALSGHTFMALRAVRQKKELPKADDPEV